MKYLTASLVVLGLAASPAMANSRIEADCLKDLRESTLPPETTVEQLEPACSCIAEGVDAQQEADIIEVLDLRLEGQTVQFPDSVAGLFATCFAAVEN